MLFTRGSFWTKNDYLSLLVAGRKCQLNMKNGDTQTEGNKERTLKIKNSLPDIRGGRGCKTDMSIGYRIRSVILVEQMWSWFWRICSLVLKMEANALLMKICSIDDRGELWFRSPWKTEDWRDHEILLRPTRAQVEPENKPARNWVHLKSARQEILRIYAEFQLV